MKERPILFSGPMVQAILGGCKTQTRRIIREPDNGVSTTTAVIDAGDAVPRWTVDDEWQDRPCPYGAPGDWLWVRETWMRAEGKFVYKADAFEDDSDEREGWWINGTFYPSLKPKWRPSIFMPREACRIHLEVVRTRAERLQSISGADARAEGYPMKMADVDLLHFGGGQICRDWYREGWDGLNAARGYGWDRNPWVWVVEFVVVYP